MNPATVTILAGLFLATALLYSSVGHAGASGYLAAMALVGVAPAVMKPTALVLNILVASIAAVRFYRAGCFSWPVFWPFAITSIPFAFLGGSLTLPSQTYKVAVGAILLYAGYRLLRIAPKTAGSATRSIPVVPALMAGLGIGLLSGLTGTGGGIFLSPLLLFMGWVETRQTSGVSAAFILVNSFAGLAGQLTTLQQVPGSIPFWLAAVAVGGWIGSEYGSRRVNNKGLQRLLAIVLVIAGIKLIFV